MSEFIPIQPSLINVFKDFPVYILNPDTAELVRFVARKGEYQHTAIQAIVSQGIDVFIRVEDHRKNSKLIEDELVRTIQGPINAQTAAVVKDLTILIVSEFLTAESVREGSYEQTKEHIDRMRRLTEYYVGILDLDNSQDVLKMIHKTVLKDYTTSTHSVNLMILALRYVERFLRPSNRGSFPSELIGNKSQLKEQATEFARSWALGALLHDIGKIHVPEEILKATRRLSDDEFRLMRMHVDMGYDTLIKMAPRLRHDEIVKGGILHHHERLDGSGYPLGLKKLTVSGKVIGILDCYEALTTDKRPYREAVSPVEALKIVRNDTDAGKFDAGIFANVVRLVATD
ncbi:MAG: HD domain-containing protein [Deltaproteobacteria bacterium]|nr:HD domain-containing protein [Deltaproteobacteria bacterium]